MFSGSKPGLVIFLTFLIAGLVSLNCNTDFPHPFLYAVLVRLAGWWAARRIWGSVNNRSQPVDLGSLETKSIVEIIQAAGGRKKKKKKRKKKPNHVISVAKIF